MGAPWVVSGAGVMPVGSLVVCSPARAQTVSALSGTPAAKPYAKPRTPPATCHAPAKAVFSIEALHEPVDGAMDFILPEIIQLAEQTAWAGNHTPLGFGIVKSDYRVIIEVDSANETTCTEPIKVSVLLVLTNRRIDIANDLARNPICLSVARHHSTLHAASDDAVLRQFAEDLSPVLSRLTLPNLQHDGAFTDEDRLRLERMIRAAIGREWPSLPMAIRAASKGVDSPDEIAALGDACVPASGGAPHPQTGTKL